MKRLRYAALAMFFASFTACNTDPGKGKSHAVVSPPAAVESAAPAAGDAVYVFDQQESKVEFVGAKVTRKHYGSFAGFNGSISLVASDPTKSSVKVSIDTATIVIDEPKLTNHLKTPDFFDVAKFPKVTFESTAVTATGAPGSFSITGNLELHGVSKSITFPATIKVSAGTVEADAEFAINRQDFGVVYPGKPDDLIRDDVLIKLSVRAHKH